MVLILSNGCSSKKGILPISQDNYELIDGNHYVRVSALGAKTNGKFNNAKVIQLAVDQYEYIFFDEGRYSLTTDVYNPLLFSSICITDKSNVRRIKFEEGAEIYIPSSYRSQKSKSCIFHIYAENDDIRSIHIDGLNIKAADRNDGKLITGIFVSETSGNLVRDFKLTNSRFENMSYTAVSTYATKSEIINLTTINSGFHGLAVSNPYNPRIQHTISVKNHISTNDKKNSVDLAGRKYYGDSVFQPSLAKLENINSKNSGAGIKIAGNWNLEFKNSTIEKSKGNGFYINYAHPGNTVKLDNIQISECESTGLSLADGIKFTGNDITVSSCRAGVLLQNSTSNISGLKIIGDNRSEFGLTMYDDGIISDLEVSGINAEYPINIVGSNNSITNGRSHDNKCVYSILIGENAKGTMIKNMEAKDGAIGGIRIKQHKGELNICNLRGIVDNVSRINIGCNN